MATRNPWAPMRGGNDETGLEAKAHEAAALLARAAGLTLVFRRLFWTAIAGLVPTAAAVVGGDWDAHPGWCLGVAGLGQAWLLGVALWAFWVYERIEVLERQAMEIAGKFTDQR